jgi:hypothetical protein
MVSIGGGAPGVSIRIDGTTLGATAADITKQRS